MKKLFFVLLAGAMMLANTSLKAQDSKGGVNGFKFGIGIEGALPTNGLTGYDVGAGLTLRFSHGVAENLDLTLTSGAMAFIPKDLSVGSATLDTKAALFIPIKLGGRYMISDNFYVMGEAGMTIIKTYLPKVTGTSGSFSSVSSNSFTYAPGVGVKFGGFDIGVRYEGLDGAGFVGARVGFTF
jgi:hypothetical protein